MKNFKMGSLFQILGVRQMKNQEVSFKPCLLIRIRLSHIPMIKLESSKSINKRMTMYSTWSNWFINHTTNDARNQNLQAFSEVLSSKENDATKLRQVVKEIYSYFSGQFKQQNHASTLPEELWRN